MIGASGARAGDASAAFRVPDPGHELAGVRLCPDVRAAGDTLGFRRGGDGWELAIARPPVSRMEYLVELRYPDGGSKIVTDPGNPRQAAGAFGPKSVLEFPCYAPPGWLTAPAGPGRSRTFDLPVPSLGGAIPVTTWSPADAADGEPLPLLVVHAGRLPARRVPVALTCGVIEENAGNNRLMAQTLRAEGYLVTLHEVPGMHNYTAWRDAFDPHLTRLPRRMCP